MGLDAETPACRREEMGSSVLGWGIPSLLSLGNRQGGKEGVWNSAAWRAQV